MKLKPLECGLYLNVNLNKNGAVSDGVLHVRLLRRERRCWERSQQVVFAEKKRV
jgi:hypothetical protein